MGVLSTAYLMMNKEGNANVPFRALQTPSYRMDAQVGNPALNQLFEMENKLSGLKAPPAKEDLKRLPTQVKTDKSTNESK